MRRDTHCAEPPHGTDIAKVTTSLLGRGQDSDDIDGRNVCGAAPDTGNHLTNNQGIHSGRSSSNNGPDREYCSSEQ